MTLDSGQQVNDTRASMIATALAGTDDATRSARSEIAQFVACLYQPEDIIEVRNCAPKGMKINGKAVGLNRWVLASELESQTDRLLIENREWNIYVGVNPRRNRGTRGVNCKTCVPSKPCGRCERCVAFARSLFVDMENIDPHRARTLWDQRGLPPPSLVISSGHGVHIYVALAHPINATAFRQAQRGLIQLFIRDGIDRSIHDPPRIMRLPGFLNHNPPAGTCATIAEADVSRRYELAEFAHLIAPVDDDASPRGLPMESETLSEGLRQRVVSLLSEGGNDRSGRDFRACIELIRAGVVKEVAYALVCELSKFRERKGTDYFERTWAAARKSLATDDTNQDLRGVGAMTPNPVRAEARTAPHATNDAIGSIHHVTFAQAAADLCARIDRGDVIIQVVRTGLALIDESTGGLPRGEAAGIVGPPGLGKSTVADQIALGVLALNPEARVYIVNLETPTKVRVARLVSGEAVQLGSNNSIARSAPIGAMLRGQLDSRGQEIALGTARSLTARIGDRLVFIDHACDAREIAKIIERDRPDLVVIDHLGLVHAPAASGDSAVDRQDNVLRVLIAALREANTAGLFLNEVNKVALTTKEYDLSSSRGSARFASLVSHFMTLHRDANDASEDARIVLTLRKNRYGKAHYHQAARFMGGLSYLHWGKLEPTEHTAGPLPKEETTDASDE